jgi:UDP:flavonoid glycosyltransferase YjiC (YdhE family)
MKITLIAAGSRGDVQPYVALGKGLKQAGHTVRVLATRDFQELITAYDLEFVDMGQNAQGSAAQARITEIVEQGNLLKILAATGQGAEQLAHQAAVSGLAACRGVDLIVAGLGGLFSGLALAEKLGIPLLQAHLMPLTPTREFSGVLTPPLPQTPLTPWTNRLSHHLTRQMMWQMCRAADYRARTEVLQTAPSPFFGPFEALRRQTQPILYGYSPQVLPPPKDWDPSIHVTGYWFLDPPAGWEPPADLMDFLGSGSPPLFIGFGSMPSRKPEETAALVLQALARSGQRGVLSSGWGGMKHDDLPKSVFMVGSIPYSWLFPRMAAVVHHGGAGTTAAGLAAGVPSIVTPFFGDQPFWGRRVHALGVGPAPIPRQRLTVERLAEAIRCAVSDAAMREKAARLGELIRAEDGVAQAAAIIEQSNARA